MQAPGGPEEDTSDGFAYGGRVAPLLDEGMGQFMTEVCGLAEQHGELRRCRRPAGRAAFGSVQDGT